MTAPNFFKIIFCVFLILSPAKAMMNDVQEEETTSKLPTHQRSIRREDLPLEPYKEDLTLDVLSDNILIAIFRFLDINDLGQVAQVSTRWRRVAEAPDLWRYMGAQYYGDYLSEEELKENPRKKVTFHALSVIVNASENLGEIGRIVRSYNLPWFSCTFKTYLPLTKRLESLVTTWSDCEELVAQLNSYACNKKIKSLAEKPTVSLESSLTARKLNEMLIEWGDQEAITRKYKVLTEGSAGQIEGKNRRHHGESGIISSEYWHPAMGYSYIFDNSPPTRTVSITYGYVKNLIAAREFNDSLVEKGNQRAIKRKIEGLEKGKFGYENNPIAAREFNELLVENGDKEAIARKISGLALGIYGYNKTLNPSSILFDYLVEKDYPWAIETKAACLYRGEWGYEKSLSATRDFLETLIERGNAGAIVTKIIGLAEGKFGYAKNLLAARNFIECLTKKGDLTAIEKRIEGLANGYYGYEKDPAAARELNEHLVEERDPEAIERKVYGLAEGRVCYTKNLDALREFNDQLVNKGDPQAVARKLRGLLEGKYGYEEDSSAAREFIENLVFCEFTVARGIGKYLKAFAMKYGITELGYKKDREGAFRFIKENHVPY